MAKMHLYRWLEGENPIVDRIADWDSLVRDLAQFVRAFHRIDPTGGPPAPRGVPLAMRDESTRTAIAALEGMIALPYYKDTNPPLAALARHALHEVLAADT